MIQGGEFRMMFDREVAVSVNGLDKRHFQAPRGG